MMKFLVFSFQKLSSSFVGVKSHQIIPIIIWASAEAVIPYIIKAIIPIEAEKIDTRTSGAQQSFLYSRSFVVCVFSNLFNKARATFYEYRENENAYYNPIRDENTTRMLSRIRLIFLIEKCLVREKCFDTNVLKHSSRIDSSKFSRNMINFEKGTI